MELEKLVENRKMRGRRNRSGRERYPMEYRRLIRTMIYDDMSIESYSSFETKGESSGD